MVLLALQIIRTNVAGNLWYLDWVSCGTRGIFDFCKMYRDERVCEPPVDAVCCNQAFVAH